MSESKLMFALWGGPAGAGLGRALRDPDLHARLAATGVRRVQLDLDDPGVARRQCFDRPVRAVVAVWTPGSAAAVALALRGVADEVAGWRVAERRLREPPAYVAHGAVVAIVRQAGDAEPERDDPWLDRWLAHRAGAATADPRVRGHVQDLVLAAVTCGAPPVRAMLEELVEGVDADPRGVDRVVRSVATLGADRELDLVPTSRRVLDLRAAG